MDWVSAARENSGEVPTRGSGNYASDEAKENALLKKEKRLREEGKRRLNVSGVIWISGVSRSGYPAFRKHVPSDSQTKKEQRMEEIRTIHGESHEIYGTPKIAEKMRRNGDRRDETQLFSKGLPMGQCLDRKLPFPDKKGMDQPVPDTGLQACIQGRVPHFCR